MADFPAPSPTSLGHDATATGVQRPPSMPSLRNRQLGRAATFSEGAAQSTPPYPMRRRSSLLSNLSLDDARQSLRSSTDSLRRQGDDPMDKFTSEEPEGSQWHSLPLSFVLFPAVAGLIWSNGNTVTSDFMLITLACIFLYWCTRLPWDWYKAAQATPIFDPIDIDPQPTGTIIEEVDEDEEDGEETLVSPPEETEANGEKALKTIDPEQKTAIYGLRKAETTALIACFLGPLLGAYFLHTLRALLSPPSESLLNDFNLSVFVMVAEARPFALVCRLERSRIAHLQRVAYPDGRNLSLPTEEVRALAQRLDLLEARFADNVVNGKEEKDVNSEISATVRQGLQPQLDALNRAVRRYEKRSVVQTMQTEARLNDLEMRLQDALSLAAAAARNGQKPGFTVRMLEWISGIFVFWIHSTWAILVYPFQLTGHFMYLTKCWVAGPPAKQASKRKSKGKTLR